MSYLLLFLVCFGIRQANACGGEKIGYNDKGKSTNVEKDLSGFGVIVADKKFKFNCCGTIKRWRVRTGGPGEVTFQVWRPTGNKDEYQLMGGNTLKFDKAENKVINIPANARISVSKGDFIGWHTKTSGMIIYDDGGINNNYVMETMPDATFGAVVDWSSANKVKKRSYSVEAIGDDNLPPSFKNLPYNKVINVDEIGNLTDPMEVYKVDVSDNDKLDIPGLKVRLTQPSPYFRVKKDTTMLVLVQKPPVRDYELELTVEDHCGGSPKPEKLTVQIKDFSTVTTTTVEPAAATADQDDEFIWDWLVYALVATAIVIVAVVLLLVFHKKGWLHKAHRTHPPRKDLAKDVEKANGKKTEPKIDDISKEDPTNKQNDVKQDGVQSKDAKPDGTKAKLGKTK